MNRSIGVLRPGAVPDLGGLGGPDRPEAPVLRARLEVEGPASSFAADFGRSSPGQGAPMSTHRVRTAISLAGQLRLGGHLIEVAVVDRVDQQALPRLARHDRRPGAAAGQDRGARVEAEVPLLLLGAVALLAAADEQRSHLALEELQGRRVRRRLGLALWAIRTRPKAMRT